ncbi:uncharacterized protein [Magallana gigas]|uniref:uncharacterized protein isoform X3 n=1 Tax=Magallana gigas TaxID=29159 RepID=UPI003341A78E
MQGGCEQTSQPIWTNHHLINHPKVMLHPNKAMPHPNKAMLHPNKAMPHPNMAMLHPNMAMHRPHKVTRHLPRGTVRHHRDTFHTRLSMFITHTNKDMPRLPNKCTPLACIPRTPAPQWLSGEG